MESIGCIGCGIMGGSVISGAAKKYDGKSIFVSAKHFDKVQKFAEENNVVALNSNTEVASKSKYIFIAVKPAYVREVLEEIKGELDESKVVVSMAAGLKLDSLAEWTDGTGCGVVRIMPNLPAVYGQAMTALCVGKNVSENAVSDVKEILESCGKVEIVDEKLMDGVTAVSGSGPAYGFMFIEALADAAVKFGIPRKQAYVYAAQTLKGAAVMALEDPRSISELKDAVCSPAGTTIEAVCTLERNGFRSAVIEGATAAFNKSVLMSKK